MLAYRVLRVGGPDALELALARRVDARVRNGAAGIRLIGLPGRSHTEGIDSEALHLQSDPRLSRRDPLNEYEFGIDPMMDNKMVARYASQMDYTADDLRAGIVSRTGAFHPPVPLGA